MAWENSRTEQLLILDVDFMPNLGQDTYMAKLFPQLRLVKGLEKAAFIPPAFGATMLKRWPRTRAQIRKMVDEVRQGIVKYSV